MSAARDLELLRKVADGDHEAFTLLMTEHEEKVFSVCLRILGDREQALDATQDAFLTVFQKSSQFKGEAAFGTWVYRIAVNTCYDTLRKQKRRKTGSLPEHYDPADPAAVERVESAALRPEIETALAAIAPEFRAAVILVDIEGLSTAQAAETLQVPAGTVKSRVFRARRLLADELGNQTS